MTQTHRHYNNCLIVAVVAEIEQEKVEGRRLYLDLVEATMKKKNANRAKKEIRKAKVRQVVGEISCISSLTAVTHRCVFTRNIHCHAISDRHVYSNVVSVSYTV